MAGEVAEDAHRQVDGDAADADRARTELRLGPYPLGHAECARHAPPEHAPQRAGGAGCLVRALHLPEDLRLAEDHRVEARRDAEDMSHRLATAPLVEVLRDSVVAGLAALLHQHLAHGGLRRAEASSPRMAAKTSTRLHVERKSASDSSGRADSRARTSGSASALEASFSRTSIGAVRCESPTTRITAAAPTHRGPGRSAKQVDEQDEHGEAEARDRPVGGSPAAPPGPRAQDEDPAKSSHVM